MDANEFARLCKAERDSILDSYCDATGETGVSARIESLSPAPDLRAAIRLILDDALTDAIYTMLLAIDGCATIGGHQHQYRLIDEDGQFVGESGDLEAAAYEHFHESQQ